MEQIAYFEKGGLLEFRKDVIGVSKQLANYIKYVKNRMAQTLANLLFDL